MMAIVPIMLLGVLAATCLLASAEWRSEKTMLLGSGEENAAAHAIVTAAAIDPDAVTAKNAPVDADIMKEVEKAEKEQVLSRTWTAWIFITRNVFLSLFRATMRNSNLVEWQADEMNTEKAFAVGNEVISDDGTGKVCRVRTEGGTVMEN